MLTKFRRNCASAIVAGLMLIGTEQAGAEIISYTSDFNSKTQASFIPLFDPTLGTLLSIDFSATGRSGTQVIFDTQSEVSGSFTVQDDFAFITSGGSVSGAYFTSGPIDFTSDASGMADLGHSFSFHRVLNPTSQFIDSPNSDSVFNLQVAASFSIMAPVGFTPPNPGGSSGTAVVSYIYTTTPEPSSIVMCMIAGLSGLGYVRSRRKPAATD